MPEISVVMPVYNGEEFLSEAIDSILSQTFGDFEFLIICEKGSNPESVDILERYAQKDERIRIIYNQERLGISESMNIGLRTAQGKYIARMDGDDISGPRRFEIQKLFLDTYPDIGVVGTFHKVTNSPNWLVDYVSDPEQIRSELLFFVPLRHPTIMFRRKFVETCYYDKDLAGVEDYDLYYKFSKVTKLTNVKMPELFTYRQTGQNASVVYKKRDHILMKQTEKQIFREQLGLNFRMSDIDVLHMLSTDAYEAVGRSYYPRVMIRLEQLLQQIENKNKELGVYREDCLHQTLQHRWYREKYKLSFFLSKDIPKELIKVWKDGKYYSPWF